MKKIKLCVSVMGVCSFTLIQKGVFLLFSNLFFEAGSLTGSGIHLLDKVAGQ